MIAPPPLQTGPRVPAGLSVCTGITGLGVAIGAGASGFLRQLLNLGFLDVYWGNVVLGTAIVALIGSMLAFAQHDAGGPIVAAAGTMMAGVVATTLTGERFDLSEMLDAYPLRGLLFLGGGAAGALAVVLGLCCLRGRAKPAFGAASAVLALGVLACHAAFIRLDERQTAVQVRPFIAIAAVIAVMVLTGFVGRSGAAGALAGAACLLPIYFDGAEPRGFPRVEFVVAAAFGSAAIIAMSTISLVLSSRQPSIQYFAGASAAGWAPQSGDTQTLPVQPTGRPDASVTGQQPAWDTQQPVGGYGSTEQLPTITQATSDSTSSMGALFQPTPVSDERSSQPTGAQWASDPYGRHQMRYWDGTRWSQYVSDGGVTDMDPV